MSQPGIAAVLEEAVAVPVVTLADPERGPELARALNSGGLHVLEITLRTPAALDAVASIAREVPQVQIGVGTVTSASELEAASEAGAAFAVSPGLTPALVRAAGEASIPLLPGVATASEVMAAREAGFTHLKLFPAGAIGGRQLLRALHGPFPDMRFCPTGGIDQRNAREYLALPNVVCVGGGWLAPAPLIAAGEWSAITELAREMTSR